MCTSLSKTQDQFDFNMKQKAGENKGRRSEKSFDCMMG